MPEQTDKYIQETDESGVVHNLLPTEPARNIAHKVNEAGDQAAKAERRLVDQILLQEYENATPEQAAMLEVMATLNSTFPEAFATGVDDKVGSVMLLRHPGLDKARDVAGRMATATFGFSKDGVYYFDHWNAFHSGDEDQDLQKLGEVILNSRTQSASVDSTGTREYRLDGLHFWQYPKGPEFKGEDKSRLRNLFFIASDVAQERANIQPKTLTAKILDGLI